MLQPTYTHPTSNAGFPQPYLTKGGVAGLPHLSRLHSAVKKGRDASSTDGRESSAHCLICAQAGADAEADAAAYAAAYAEAYAAADASADGLGIRFRRRSCRLRS